MTNPHGTFAGGTHAHRKGPIGVSSLSGGNTVSTALSSFDKATAVERNGSGRFVAHVDPAWDGPGAPLGGVVMATILRAMTAELAAADLAPRSVTLFAAWKPRPSGRGGNAAPSLRCRR